MPTSMALEVNGYSVDGGESNSLENQLLTVSLLINNSERSEVAKHKQDSDTLCLKLIQNACKSGNFRRAGALGDRLFLSASFEAAASILNYFGHPDVAEDILGFQKKDVDEAAVAELEIDPFANDVTAFTHHDSHEYSFEPMSVGKTMLSEPVVDISSMQVVDSQEDSLNPFALEKPEEELNKTFKEKIGSVVSLEAHNDRALKRKLEQDEERKRVKIQEQLPDKENTDVQTTIKFN